MLARVEVAIVIVETVRAIEAVLERHAVNVPFAGMVRTISERPQHLWEQPSPGRTNAARAALDPRHCVSPHLLRVIAGENASAGGPASRRIVELRKPQAVLCEGI